MKKLIYFLFITLILASCEPVQAPDIELGAAPGEPEFSVEVMASNPNMVIVTDLSNGNFARVWDFGENADGDRPIKQRSSNSVDTVEYLKAGEYTITLHVSAESGGGTAQSSKSVTIAQDAQVSCSPKIALLTGDCLPAGKCWTFSQVAGAITVGSTPGNNDFFVSSAADLAPAQYDDNFCFYADGASFLYNNNGQTIDPWNGYAAVDYTPPTDHTWTFSPGTGNDGKDQIILTTGSFLGVWDASNFYDIVTLTETNLVVQTPFLAGGGWFELYFVRQ